jgi:hypothetical protein
VIGVSESSQQRCSFKGDGYILEGNKDDKIWEQIPLGQLKWILVYVEKNSISQLLRSTHEACSKICG